MSSRTTSNGQTVWLARKANQSALVSALEKRGFAVLDFSPVDTVPHAKATIHSQLAALSAPDGVVFVSPTAAEVLLVSADQFVDQQWLCFCPGTGTAATLKRLGFADVHSPTQTFTSEGMLALPRLQNVAGKRFWIVAGEGGRPLIADTLTARGADVTTIECYTRQAASHAPAKLQEGFSTAVFSSSQAFKIAFRQWPALLNNARVIVSSERIAADVAASDFSGELIVCKPLDANSLTETLCG